MFQVTTFDIRNLYICDKSFDIKFSIKFVKNMFTLNAQESFESIFRKNECEQIKINLIRVRTPLCINALAFVSTKN